MKFASYDELSRLFESNYSMDYDKPLFYVHIIPFITVFGDALSDSYVIDLVPNLSYYKICDNIPIPDVISYEVTLQTLTRVMQDFPRFEFFNLVHLKI